MSQETKEKRVPRSSGQFTAYYVEARTSTFMGTNPVTIQPDKSGMPMVLSCEWERVQFPDSHNSLRDMALGMFDKRELALAAAWGVVACSPDWIEARIVPIKVTYEYTKERMDEKIEVCMTEWKKRKE